MARTRLYEYSFTPGSAGLGTVKVPDRYNLADILAIYDTTTNTAIYNFADATLGGTVSWAAGTTATFPTAYAGVTTITLDLNTTGLSANDKLAIYVEERSLSVQPWGFGMDAIGRERVSNPESLIDADFEYGLQNTKWENVSTTNNIPSFYEDIGADIVYNTNGYVTLLAGDDLITSNVDTSVRFENQGTASAQPWVANDYVLITSQTQGNITPLSSTFVTAAVNSSAERTFTVGSTTGFTAGDLALIIGRPTSGGTTTAVAAITSNLTTTLNVTSASGAGMVDGSYIIVQTDTANVYEVMAITNVATNALTVVRQSNRTNSAAANIAIGNNAYTVATLEVAQVQSVTDGTTLQLNRGWYNTVAANTYATGTVLQRLSANVELCQHTVISTAVNGVQTITRGEFNTTALTAAGVGSPVVRMTGMFYATGANTIPQVGVNQSDTPLDANEYVSTQNTASSNTEGVGLVFQANVNNFFYYPRRSPSLAPGFPLNQTDTIIRQAYPYTGGAMNVASILADGANPATITVTTTYAHGLVPGTPILMNLSSGTNFQYAEGSFTIISIPSTTTFTYQAKTGVAVTGALVGSAFVRSNAAFLPRPFDGGVLIGPGTPTRGASAIRVTKKYFRYQSGKGILFSTGTVLAPTFDVTAVSADGTTVLSNITITTDVEHGLNAGATVTLSGVTTSGYNQSGYIVASVASDTSFVVQAQATLGSTTPELGQNPRLNITAWHGSSIRGGIFDDQNGLFWENNGITVNAVQRTSTNQLAGLVSVGVGSNLVTGDGNCRFQDQLNNGDLVVIKGMSHTVTSIIDNNRMTVVPPFRGVVNQNRVRMALRTEIRVRQADFNIDPLDGNGPSGFTLDASKMQMYALEYSWYGAGTVIWMLRGQTGTFVHAHRRPNNNINNEAYMRSGNLPARYEAINETPVVGLSGAIDASVTTITLTDATDYPPASVAYPAYVMIDSEIIKYSGKAGNQLTGCTRGATFTQWADGQSRSYTSSAAASHTNNTGVILISNTCVPLVSHWGSAVIMDGNFNGDEGYQFTYNRINYGLPAAIGDKATAFAMRLAPSVSNGIIGDLGVRDLINRAALTLSNLNIQVTAGRYLVEGILNPSNIDSANTSWQGLNNLGGGFQPSFSQFSTAPRYTSEATGGLTSAAYNTTGGMTRSGVKITFSTAQTYANLTPVNVSSSGANARITVQLTAAGTAYSTTTTQITVQTAGTGYAVGDTIRILGNTIGGSTTTNDLNMTIAAITSELNGGERLFAIPISTTNSGVLDLSSVKQIGTSSIPGTGTYPNGPEVLAVQITALSTNVAPVGEIQLQFQESQA
jgi:membrane-bound inhibitor of C-type lysozyme